MNRACIQITCAHDTYSPKSPSKVSLSLVSPGSPRAILSSCPGCPSLLRVCLSLLPPPNPRLSLHARPLQLSPSEHKELLFQASADNTHFPASCCCEGPPSPFLRGAPTWFCLTPGVTGLLFDFLKNSFSHVSARRVVRPGQIQLVNVYSG